MTTCDYQMIPAKRDFPVWTCAKDEGHGGGHWIGPLDLERRLRLRDAYAIGAEKGRKAKEVEYVTGTEVDLETLVKRTKGGAINTQSTLGKVVSMALGAGCDVRAWASSRASGVCGAHHGLRFSVTGADVMMNGRPVPKEQLFIRLEELA